MQHSRKRRIVALLAGLTLAAGSAAAASGAVGATTEPAEDTEAEDTEAEDTEAEEAEATEAEVAEATEPEDEAEEPEEPEEAEVGEPAGMAEEANPTCEGESDGVLHIATVLPETGNLAFLGPPEFAGAELAAQHINEAGGVLGQDIILDQGDSGDTSTDIANQTVDRQLAAGADVFVGAASSSVSFTFIDKLVENCKIHFSPANTSPDFTTYPDDDLYFRTAPSDVLQGRVLGELLIEEGMTNAVFLALQDDYGDGLLENSTLSFEANGGQILDAFSYDPFAASFAAEVDRIVSAAPEAVVLIGFDESSQILQTMFEQGITAETTNIYLVDGNIGNALGADLPPGSLVGVKGTLPTAEVPAEFQNELLEVDPGLVDFSYGPETYDAITIVALAAEAAGTDNPAEIARHIRGVTRDGTECGSFADCRDLLEAGDDIMYVGPSGPSELNDDSERTKASFAVLCYDEENRVDGDCEPSFQSVEL